MPDADSVLPATGVGGFAVLTGVVACLGLKLLGGAVLFGGIAAAIGVTTDQLTFLLGGSGGLAVAIVAYGYHTDRIELAG